LAGAIPVDQFWGIPVSVEEDGADVGIPDQAVTLATVLKSMGYATAKFGKNHLGNLNKYLPTVHGFDEYFGYLDAMSDPYWFDYPQDWIDKYGPRAPFSSSRLRLTATVRPPPL
jgi:arylsulfatase A-like enzyme